jgi:hypothetical protein
MYRRETRQQRADGALVTPRQRAERVWNPHKNRSEVRMVHHGGRADAPQRAERLRQLARRLLKRWAPEAIVEPAPPWRVLEAWPVGARYVLEAIWQRLGLAEGIAPPLASRHVDCAVERALLAMVAHRACAPRATLDGDEPGWREDGRLEGTDPLALPHLDRAMEVLDAHQEAMEHALYGRLADLRRRDGALMFYDTTARHCDIEEVAGGGGDEDCVDGRLAAGSKTYQAPRQRGLSQNGRGDAPHMVVGLAVTRDGFPVRPGVFPGHTVAVRTVTHVKDDLRGWHLSRGVVVGDAGMGSQDHRHKLRARGGTYRLWRPRRRGEEGTREVLPRPGRDPRGADHLRVKAVVVGDGARRRRAVVCHTPQAETRQRAHRQQRRRELDAERASRTEVRGEGQTKRGCELRASHRDGRDRRLTNSGLLRMDAAKPRAEARLDGTCVVHRNDDRLTPAALALGYTPRPRVEEAWRTLTRGWRLRPVCPWAPHRIHAQVALRVWALF